MNIKEDLVFREYLATERTDLAIDRTILAYTRTAMTIIVVGISFIKLFRENFVQIIGSILIFVSICLILYGFYRSYRMKKRIKKFFKKL